MSLFPLKEFELLLIPHPQYSADTGPGPPNADRDAAIIGCKERFWKQHSSNPASHWIMVHEIRTGKLIGASKWLVNETNPFPNGPPKIIATWWPEGTVGLEFASEMLNQAYVPRTSWMRRPCIVLNIMSTHPDCRRRGIGFLMMAFGEEKAQELECRTEGSEDARFLYEKFGHRVLIKYSLDAKTKVMSGEWRKLAHDHMPQEVYAMWKSAGGGFTGKTVLPWDLGASPSS